MGTAFTPGLTITEQATIRKTRRLPVRGEVLVGAGARVSSDTVVARVDIPGPLAVAKAAQKLGCAPEQLHRHCTVKEGSHVDRDQVIAQRSVFFGLITNRCHSPRSGTVEYVSQLSGNIGIRAAPRPVTCAAYISGIVTEVLPGEGVIIETNGAYVQGIFGVGGERHGRLCWIGNGRDTLRGDDIKPQQAGTILMHAGRIDATALPAAVEHNILGIVGASMVDSELMDFLGFNIGVAITGEEAIPFSLILTEGFGQMSMPTRTEELLTSLDGMDAAINGATQIRAGVIRPEIIVPRAGLPGKTVVFGCPLEVGVRVRLIRRPGFGRAGTVTSLPEKPMIIASGSNVRVLKITLDDGMEVIVPRSNVEILSTP